MSINKAEILRNLPTFDNYSKMLVKEQNTGDIIKAIVKAHENYSGQYDKICSFFYNPDEVVMAENIFNFIKKNVKYEVEPDDLQQIKSPAAIFNTPASDCKNYALAINGILDAIRRKYKCEYDLYYRFASYDGTNTPQHVFAVMVLDNEEIWIDPVLDYFNEYKEPDYFKDKKIKKMLVGLSGTDPYKNYANSYTRSIAAIPAPPKLTLAQGTGLNTATAPSSSPFNFGSLSSLLTGSGDVKTITSNPIIQSGLSMLPGGNFVAQILPQLESLFGAKRGAAGTEYGAKMYLQMYPDVAAAGYEPWAHFQENGWREGRYWFENPSVTKETVDDYLNRYPDVKRTWDNSVLQHYLEYGKSEGRTIKLSLTPEQAARLNAAVNTGTQDGDGDITTKTAGMSPFIILAIIGAGIYMFTKKK